MLRKGDLVLFIGDSITDCGRRAEHAPLGNGYVSIFKDLVDVSHPQLRLRVVNKGISGDTILGLRERWEDDVLSHSPKLISILIGINDLHRYLRGEEEYSPESYYKAYREILRLTRNKLEAEILLLSPFYISKASELDTFRRKVLTTIPSYIDKVEKLSTEFSTYYIDLHEKFMERLKYMEPEALAPEPVHPNRKGHLLIALEIYNLLFRSLL